MLVTIITEEYYYGAWHCRIAAAEPQSHKSQRIKVKEYIIEHYIQIQINKNKIYIAPGILKRIGAQTHGVSK